MWSPRWSAGVPYAASDASDVCGDDISSRIRGSKSCLDDVVAVVRLIDDGREVVGGSDFRPDKKGKDF